MEENINLEISCSNGNIYNISTSCTETPRSLIRNINFGFPKDSIPILIFDGKQLSLDLSFKFQGVHNNSKIKIIMQKVNHPKIFTFSQQHYPSSEKFKHQKRQLDELFRESIRLSDISFIHSESIIFSYPKLEIPDNSTDITNQDNPEQLYTESSSFSISDQPLPTPWDSSLPLISESIFNTYISYSDHTQ